MSINFGYTAPSAKDDETTEAIENLKASLITEKARVTNIKSALVSLSTQVNLVFSYDTVFEINTQTATQTNDTGLAIIRSTNEKSTLTSGSWNRPPEGHDYIENIGRSFMSFICHELMYPNVSVFVVCSVLSTAVLGDWVYLIGNDDGAYDKFIGYKKGVTNVITHGGSYPIKKNEITLPSTVDITTKHLVSLHWLMNGSCVWANGSKVNLSDFTSYQKRTGEPFATIFYNDRLPSSSGGGLTTMTGRIYGIKIVTGLITPTDILKIHTELIVEHNIAV